MKLTITTPLEVIVSDVRILSLRAEDASGSFMILPHHADFMTVLGISVVSWRDSKNKLHYCAMSKGILIMTGGHNLSIASREAVMGHDLVDLKEHILKQFSATEALESKTRLSQERLQAETIQYIQDYLHQEDHFAPST